MKRDVDFIRQLLFEIERHGADCSFDALRSGSAAEIDERTPYHVRLLIDAGLVKETDRTSAGSPCVRLTNAGHEFLDLCRGGARWREAKWVVQEESGGLSLSLLRAVLTKWAVESIAGSARYRRLRHSYRRYYYRGKPVYRIDSYRDERKPPFDEEPFELVRPRPEYRRRIAPAEHWEDDHLSGDGEAGAGSYAVSLPVSMI
jgi:hypothetical protein